MHSCFMNYVEINTRSLSCIRESAWSERCNQSSFMKQEISNMTGFGLTKSLMNSFLLVNWWMFINKCLQYFISACQLLHDSVNFKTPFLFSWQTIRIFLKTITRFIWQSAQWFLALWFPFLNIYRYYFLPTQVSPEHL